MSTPKDGDAEPRRAPDAPNPTHDAPPDHAQRADVVHLRYGGPAPRRAGRRWLRALGALALLGLLVLGAAVAALWIWGPELAEGLVRDKLASVAKRIGHTVDLEGLEVVGSDKVIVRGLKVERQHHLMAVEPAPLLHIPQTIVHVDLIAAVLDEPRIARVELIEPRVTLLRLPNGDNDLDPLIRAVRDRLGARDDGAPDSGAQASGGGGSALRRAFAELPEVRLTGGHVHIQDRLDPDRVPDSDTLSRLERWLKATPSPLLKAHSITVMVQPEGRTLSDGLVVQASATLVPATGAQVPLPERVEWTLRKASAAEGGEWKGDAAFQPPLTLGALPGAEQLSASLGGVVLDDTQTLRLREVAVRAESQRPALLTAKGVDVETSGFARGFAALEVRKVVLDTPVVHIVSHPGEPADPRVVLKRLVSGERVVVEDPPKGDAAKDDKDNDTRKRDRRGKRRKRGKDDAEKPQDALTRRTAQAQQAVARMGAFASRIQRLRYVPGRVEIKAGALTWERHLASDGSRPVTWRADRIDGHIAHAVLDHALQADLTLKLPNSQTLGVDGRYGYKAQSINAALKPKGVDLVEAARKLGLDRLKPIEVARATGTVRLVHDAPDAPWTLDTNLQFNDVHIMHRMLSDRPVKDLDFALGGVLTWTPASGDLVLNDGLFRLEEAATLKFNCGLYGIGRGLKRAPVDLREAKLRVAMKPTAAQDIYDAVPHGMRYALDGMRFKGTVGFTLTADIDAHRIRHMKTSSDVQLDDFDIVAYNDHADVRRLQPGKFTHTTTQPKTGYVYTISDDSPDWAPLNRVSPYVVKAIRTNEDGSFYSHKGFSWLQVKSSIERNVRERRYVRGASTVSMQLVKNVFLSHQKTLSRKLQEALLTFAMEQVVDIPKNRIMEVYLNIIEMGPYVYGIRNAARHYFNKSPGALSLGESVFLISILPGPRLYHRYYDVGWISEGWWSRMKRLMAVMLDRKHITEEEYEAAIERRPGFRKKGSLLPTANDANDRDDPPKPLEDTPVPKDAPKINEIEADAAARDAIFGTP